MKQLNTYADFKNFYFELIDFSQTLPLILNNKKKIVNVILANLKNPLMRKEMLKLLPPLIRDCQEEIFDIFCNEILFGLIELFEGEHKIKNQTFILFIFNNIR
jgi:hypothetical protein